MTSSNKLWEILVPRFSNEGLEYTLEHHKEWDNYVRQISNGITILRTAKGQWISPDGQLCAEEMIPVRIFCKDSDIEQIVDHTILYYDQEAVFSYEISSNVILRYRLK